MKCRLYLHSVHWGPGHPPVERGPSLKVFTGFPLQLIFAKVKAENQQHLLHRYLQLSQHSTRSQEQLFTVGLFCITKTVKLS